jgi:tetratricopeptide (TPR) repeat protein
VQRIARRYPEALGNARRSLGLIQPLLEQDPKNKLLQIDYHMGLILSIDLLQVTGDLPTARVETARAIRFLQPLVEAAEPSLYDLQDYVLLLVSTPFPEFRNDANAVRFAVRAAAMTSRKDPETLDLLARALGRNGDAAQAAATEREALALLPSTNPGAPVPEMVSGMAANLRRFERDASSPPRAQAQ